MIGGSAGGSAGCLTFHHSPGGRETCCVRRGASGIGGGTGGKMGSCGGGKSIGTSSAGGRGSAGTGTGGRVTVVRSSTSSSPPRSSSGSGVVSDGGARDSGAVRSTGDVGVYFIRK